MKTKPTDSVKNLERITKRGMWWVRLDRAEELITQARAEERERVSGIVKSNKKPLIHDVNWAEGYNQALDTILSSLDKPDTEI